MVLVEGWGSVCTGTTSPAVNLVCTGTQEGHKARIWIFPLDSSLFQPVADALVWLAAVEWKSAAC